jgi:hypothetical protein
MPVSLQSSKRSNVKCRMGAGEVQSSLEQATRRRLAAADASSDEVDDDDSADESYLDQDESKLVGGALVTPEERQTARQVALMSSTFLTEPSTPAAMTPTARKSPDSSRMHGQLESGSSDTDSSCGPVDAASSADSMDSIWGKRGGGSVSGSSGEDGLLEEDEGDVSESSAVDSEGPPSGNAGSGCGSDDGGGASGRGSDDEGGASGLGSDDDEGGVGSGNEAEIEGDRPWLRRKRGLAPVCAGKRRKRPPWTQAERQSHEPVQETLRSSWKRRKEKQEQEHAARVFIAEQANSKLRRVLDAISDSNAEPLKRLVADVSKAETHLLGYDRRARVMLEYALGTENSHRAHPEDRTD